MGSDVVTAVEEMALQEGHPLLRSTALLFEWRPGVPINDKKQLDYEVVHGGEPFVKEDEAIMSQGNEILHDAGDTNEELNLDLVLYVNTEVVDVPEPIVDEVLDGREDGIDAPPQVEDLKEDETVR